MTIYRSGQGAVTITNMITNSGFENGTTGWIGSGNSISVSNGIMTATVKAGYGSSTRNTTAIANSVGDIFYIKCKAKTSAPNLSFGAFDGATGNLTSWLGAMNFVSGSYVDTGFRTNISGLSSFFVGFYNSTGADITINADFVEVFNLTSVFGAGNEPSKEWCDANIGYFEGSRQIMNPNSSTFTNYQIKKQYRGLSGVNREIKHQFRGYSGVNRRVFGVAFEQYGDYGPLGDYVYSDTSIYLKVGSLTDFEGESSVRVLLPTKPGDVIRVTCTTGRSGASYYLDWWIYTNTRYNQYTYLGYMEHTATTTQSVFRIGVSKSPGSTNQVGWLNITKIEINGEQIFPIL